MLTTTTNKGFQLTIGSETVASTLGTKSTKVGNNYYTIKIHYIAFNRQLYKPNSIVADIQFMTTPLSSDYETLVGKEVELTRLVKAESAADAPATNETFSGYYVYDILPLRSANQNLYLRLHIFSLDHQITIQKYSRTYVGKKLFADILCGIDYSKNDTPAYTSATFAYNTSPATLTHPFQTYYLKDTTNDVYTTFDHLSASISYNANESSTATKKTTEIIQPYLVQYNESFYDFLARTANRCGEFFFWEDNALHLGRTYTGTNLATSIADTECLSLYYNSINTATTFDTKSLQFDDLNDFSSSTVRELNHSKQGSAFGQASSFCVNPAVRHDTYRTRVYKDKFASTANEKWSNLPKYLLSFVSKAFREVSLYDILKKILLLEPFSYITARSVSDGTNNYFNEYNITKDTRLHKDQRTCVDDKKNVYDSLFTTADEAGHPTANFYDTILTNEERQTRQIVTFNLADTKKLRLGQPITFDSKTYYVIQIKECPTMVQSKFAKMDAEAEKEFQDLDGGIMQVRAIPAKSATEIYPPLLPSGHVRTSEPQVAFVAEYMDPEHRGRVRIRYPWQNGSSDTEPSPWIRVLTPSATPGSGCFFELAQGDEVLVNYESNNIERPYVAGTLYNRQNAVPFRRGDLAIVSKNGHAIAFDDPVDASKFAESISPSYAFIKSIIHPIKPNGELSALKLTGGITLSDAYGFYKIAMSTDQRKIDISSPFGNVNIDAFTGINIIAPNGDINIKGQNINIEAGNAVKITSGVNIKKKGYLYKFADVTDSPLKLAAQAVALVTDSIADYVKPLVTIVDIDLLRKMAEVIVRPIDGTMQIKSHQYLMLEAGEGETAVQPDRYSKYDENSLPDGQKLLRQCAALIGAIELIETTANSLFSEIEQERRSMLNSKASFDHIRQNIINITVGEDCIQGDDIVTAVYNGGGEPLTKEYKADSAELSIMPEIEPTDVFLTTFIENANTLASSSLTYFQLTKTPMSYIVTQLLGKDKSSDLKTHFYPYINDAFSVALEDFSKLKWNLYEPDNQNHKSDLLRIKKIVYRNCFVTLVNTNKTGFFFLRNDLLDESHWQSVVDALNNESNLKPDFDPFSQAYKTFYTQYTDFYHNFKDRNHWKAEKTGQIILSDQPGQSYYFDNHGEIKRYANGSDIEDATNITLTAIKTKLSSWIDGPIEDNQDDDNVLEV